jgi:hypothetical protein
VDRVMDILHYQGHHKNYSDCKKGGLGSREQTED